MVKNKIKKLQFGFTLFEMIIVVGIIAIITGISFSYYRKYSEGKKLDGEAKKLANTISLALKKSSSGNQENCINFIGTNILFESSNTWSLNKVANDNSIICKQEKEIARYELENNIELISTDPLNLSSISFNKLGSGLLFSPTATQATITLKNKALETKNCIDLNINQAGIVNIEERQTCQ